MAAQAPLDDLERLSEAHARAEARATVVITTKDRADLAADAVASSLEQVPAIEVLVVDDGSTDGTSDHLLDRFSDRVTLLRAERSAGYILRRNQGAMAAAGNFVVSIDDDALFSTPDVVARALTAFDHPRIGAVAMPYVNVNQDDVVRQHPPGPGIWVAESYIGTAHALRRSLFLDLGGYRPQLVHQGEERDLCVRMLERGYVVRLATSPPVHHLETPRRDFDRMDRFGRRNDVLFAWHNVPPPFLVAHLAATTARGAIFGVRVRRPRRMLQGLLDGFASMPGERHHRRPVSRHTYRLNRQLRRRGPLRLETLEPRLPPLEHP